MIIDCQNIEPKLLGRLMLKDVSINFHDGITKNLLCDVCNKIPVDIDAHFKSKVHFIKVN